MLPVGRLLVLHAAENVPNFLKKAVHPKKDVNNKDLEGSIAW